MTDATQNVIRLKTRPRLVHDCQREGPRPLLLPDALRAFHQRQARTRAEIARDKIEEGFAELKAAAGADAAQDHLRYILLVECTS